MISNSQQLRTSPSTMPLTKSISIIKNQVVSPQTFIEIKKKTEKKQSMLIQTLKSSIISDNVYTSEIYEWRKIQTAPIVKVIQLGKTNETDIITGFPCIHNIIKSQPIFGKLNSFQHFSKEYLLLILKNMLDGHQAIFKKMKATSVSLQKSVITMQGQIKVWVNQYFERNDISGQILSKQEDITKRIFQLISFLSNNCSEQKLSQFFFYVNSCMKKNGWWTFSSLKAMLKSYTECLRINIPKQLDIQQINMNRRQMQSSFISIAQPKIFFPCSHQKIFQASNRNIQSKLNILRENYRSTNQLLFDNIFESRKNRIIYKDIQEKSTCSTIKSLASQGKHTRSVSQFKTYQDYIIQQPKINCHSKNVIQTNITNIHENRKISSINNILLAKIGFESLAQVNYDEQCSSSSSAQKSHKVGHHKQLKVNFEIQQQFNLVIESQKQPTKQSSISTTNQTLISGKQLSFSKKFKGSHFTINLEDKQNIKKEQFRTASRDRFKQSFTALMSQYPKKTVESCTNWSNNQNLFQKFDIITLLNKVESSNLNVEEEIFKQKSQYTPIIVNKQIQSLVSFKNIVELQKDPRKQANPLKNTQKIFKQYLKNPLCLLNQLKSKNDIESYENTQKNSSFQSPSRSAKRLVLPIKQKILQLLNFNKRLVVSTYMQTSSQKKIKQYESPQKYRNNKLKDIQQTLSELVRVNLKQDQILSGNCWTKKLQNLLQIQEELKQSINFGPQQASALLRQIKLSKLGNCGRSIGNSVINQSL